MTNNDVLREAISVYGSDCQMDKAIEEMAELTKALLKWRYATNRYEQEIIMESVNEEMADVRIMMNQLAMMFHNDADVDVWMDKKIERLEHRLRKGKA